MLNLGHAHPDFTYANDPFQAKLTMGLLLPAALICCVMIIAGVFAM